MEIKGYTPKMVYVTGDTYNLKIEKQGKPVHTIDNLNFDLPLEVIITKALKGVKDNDLRIVIITAIRKYDKQLKKK